MWARWLIAPKAANQIARDGWIAKSSPSIGACWDTFKHGGHCHFSLLEMSKGAGCKVAQRCSLPSLSLRSHTLFLSFLALAWHPFQLAVGSHTEKTINTHCYSYAHSANVAQANIQQRKKEHTHTCRTKSKQALQSCTITKKERSKDSSPTGMSFLFFLFHF